jgi:hypothetical protein
MIMTKKTTNLLIGILKIIGGAGFAYIIIKEELLMQFCTLVGSMCAIVILNYIKELVTDYD